jgi:hypothetical protein
VLYPLSYGGTKAMFHGIIPYQVEFAPSDYTRPDCINGYSPGKQQSRISTSRSFYTRPANGQRRFAAGSTTSASILMPHSQYG